jgi:hypothetical protein
MKPTVAVELLRAQHGDENALEIALQEQLKARRARSRRRFEFWGAVATLIGQGCCDMALETEPVDPSQANLSRPSVPQPMAERALAVSS